MGSDMPNVELGQTGMMFACGDMLKGKVYSFNPPTEDGLKVSIQHAVFPILPAELQCAVKMFLTCNLHM
jgi:hypothetical protein